MHQLFWTNDLVNGGHAEAWVSNAVKLYAMPGPPTSRPAVFHTLLFSHMWPSSIWNKANSN